MNWLALIPKVFGLGASVVDGWIQRKQTAQEHKQRIEEAKTNAYIRRLDNDQAAEREWDTQQAVNAENSWKDEYWTIVLSIPAVMCFIPGLHEYVRQGFDVLKDTPEWYQIALLGAIAASFAIRKIIDFKVKNKAISEE